MADPQRLGLDGMTGGCGDQQAGDDAGRPVPQAHGRASGYSSKMP
jgi:hypothetical protein